MKKGLLFLLAGLLISLIMVPNTFGRNLKNVNIGIVHDGLNDADELLANLKHELNILLGSKYKISIPAEKILNGAWSAANITLYYNQLAKDRNVDIILGLGILTSSVLTRYGKYSKPVIVVGVFDPQLQGIAMTDKNTSGVHNFTYTFLNRPMSRDLDVFYQVYPYKKIGVVFFDEMAKILLFSDRQIQDIMQKNHTEFTLIPVSTGIEDVLMHLGNIDAVYLGFLGKFEGPDKRQLIKKLNNKGLPTFGWTVTDVRDGALASSTSETNFQKIFRRIALNVEAVLEGQDPSQLPVILSLKEKIVINMETAEKINFSPKFTTLSKATLINEFIVQTDRKLNLIDVMHDVMKTSLDLKIEGKSVLSAKKDVWLARTRFLPSLTLGINGVQIDKERAERFLGQQAEQTISDSIALEQLIFSEQAFGSLAIQKYLRQAASYGYEQVKNDIVLDAAIAYFNVLRAKTLRKIRKDSVDLTEQNLEIAKQREVVGYSGRSDVFRWESKLASATTDLLEAQNNVTLAKIQLNQILNHPLDEAFIAQEEILEDTVYNSYLTTVKEYMDNPRSIKRYTNFLIAEAIKNSPEIRQLDANMAALKRSLLSYKLKRFVPGVGLGAEAQHIRSRSGAGTDFPGIDPQDDSWNVGINISLPLVEGGATSVNIQQTRIDMLALKDRRAQMTQYVELNLRAAILEVMVKMVNLESSKRSAEFADKSLDLVQDAYAKGGVSVVELMDAQNAALNAESNSLNSIYEFFTGVLKVERAVGKFTLLSSAREQEAFAKRSKAYLKKP